MTSEPSNTPQPNAAGPTPGERLTPCVPPAKGEKAYEMVLARTEDRLEIQFPERGGPNPIHVDFVEGPMGYARHINRFGSLYKAVGYRNNEPLHIIDATAGLGRDAFRLAYHGCTVTAIERSPILFALLQDGLRRAETIPEIRDQLDHRLTFIHADAREYLHQLAPGNVRTDADATTDASRTTSDTAPHEPPLPDVVYLDPMYPPSKKTALVKVEMRILRQLVGDDLDADALFAAAADAARHRVVVKRHRHAHELAPNPTHSHQDKNTRYDVYMHPQSRR